MADSGTYVGFEQSIESPRSPEPISPRNEDTIMLDLSTPREHEDTGLAMLPGTIDVLKDEEKFSDSTVAIADSGDLGEGSTDSVSEIHDFNEDTQHEETCMMIMETNDRNDDDMHDFMEHEAKQSNYNELDPIALDTKRLGNQEMSVHNKERPVDEFTAIVTENEGLVILKTETGMNGADELSTETTTTLNETKKEEPNDEPVHNKKDILEEEATVSLENILNAHKRGDESDSDSEFDFDLPTQATETGKQSGGTSMAVTGAAQQSSTRMVQQAAVGSLQSTEAVSEAGGTIQPMLSQQHPATVQQTTITVHKQGIQSADKHQPVHQEAENTGIASSPASAQDQTTPQKPVAIIKPMPIDSAAVSKYVTETGSGSPEDQRKHHVMASARAEWDNVTTVQAGPEPAVLETLPMMSPRELTQYFNSLDFTDVKPTIKTGVERRGLAALVQFLFGPSKLNKPLHQDRDLIFCIAASPLNNDDLYHMRTLQTIYKCLTGSKFDCPRTGGHWEEIGFQGNDPGTDLRGAGLLGLLNLIYFLHDPKTQTIANEVYRLSLHPTQNFPFCLMGINMSRILLQLFREGILNKECNRRTDILGVVSEFYAGLYLQMYQVWKSKGKTIVDSGFVIKDIELQARKNPRAVFKNLDEYLNKRNPVIVAERLGHEHGGDHFMNVCDDHG